MDTVIDNLKAILHFLQRWWPLLSMLSVALLTVAKSRIYKRWIRPRIKSAAVEIFDSVLCESQRYTELDNRVAHIYQNFGPNGGKAALDILGRIENDVISLFALQEHSDVPLFRADATGKLIYANHAFEWMCASSLGELIGMGWLNSVAIADRDRVLGEWHDAIAQQRACHIQVPIVAGQRVITVHWVARPVKRRISQEIFEWSGRLQMLSPFRSTGATS